MTMGRFSHCQRKAHAGLARAVIRLSLIATVALPVLGFAQEVRSPDHRFSLEFETGAVWQSRNQIQIPDSSNGTRFGLTDIQGNGPNVQRRVELTWNLSHQHSLRFVYAPLGFSGTGSFGSPVRFSGGTFAPGVPVDSDYKFDSYRLTYRYLVHESERWRWRIGATAFIRDARVELRQQGRVASDSNVGFVPLLSTSLEYDIAPRWTALFDFDGLVSTQGRAIDAALKIRYDLTDHWFITAGYRVFEGGVDNDRYAFGWYNFALVSVGVRF
ncbi:MAG: hypothetical protein KF793_13370 [Nitrospira sp.]|nr:hypothetical protein [Nitrospira sp.]